MNNLKHLIGFLVLVSPAQAWSNSLNLPVDAMTTEPPKILSVGLSAVDFVATVDHYPEPDEKMRSSSLLVEGGGNAANTACAMAGLLPVGGSTLLTAVGDDPNGQIILGGLADRGAQVISETYPGSSPFTYILSHTDEKTGDNTRTCIHQPSAGDLTVDFINASEEKMLQEMTAVHFDVRYPDAAMALAQHCVQRTVPYSVDVERPRPGLAELMKDATVVICNSEYCRNTLKAAETDDQDLTDAECLLKVMKEQAPNAMLAVQTLGAKGSVLVFCNDELRQQAVAVADKSETVLPVETDGEKKPSVTLAKDGSLYCGSFTPDPIVDTTGAGDSFIGGFLTAFWTAQEKSSTSIIGKEEGQEDASPSLELPQLRAMGRALRIGSRVAAKKIEKPGARSGLPTLEQDEVLQKEFRALLLDEEPTDDSSGTSSSSPNVLEVLKGFFQGMQ